MDWQLGISSCDGRPLPVHLLSKITDQVTLTWCFYMCLKRTKEYSGPKWNAEDSQLLYFPTLLCNEGNVFKDSKDIDADPVRSQNSLQTAGAPVLWWLIRTLQSVCGYYCEPPALLLPQVFGNIELIEESAIHRHNNFQTFFQALTLLFRFPMLYSKKTYCHLLLIRSSVDFNWNAFAPQERHGRGVARDHVGVPE